MQTNLSQPSTAGADACTPLTLAPMSPAVAKVWHQLQAAMLKEAHSVDAVPAGVIVLPALPQDRTANFKPGYVGDRIILQLGCDDNEDTYTQYWSCPTGWERFWNQSHWHLNRVRRGPDGDLWSASGGRYVVDNFGDLVEVAA